LLAERTNGLIVTVSRNVSHCITVVATYNASGFVSTKIRGVVCRPTIFTLCAIVTEKARRDYGSYASEILEGQQTTQEDAQTHLNETFHVDRHNLNNNETVQKISVITKSSGNNVRHLFQDTRSPFQCVW
jgi:hypothetical protein